MPVNSLSRFDCVYLGMDGSKHSIAVGVLEPDQADAVVNKIAHDEASVRRLIGRFPDARLRVGAPSSWSVARSPAPVVETAGSSAEPPPGRRGQ